MKHTLKSVRTLAVTIITIGSLAGRANGAITWTQVDPTTAKASFDPIIFTHSETFDDNQQFYIIVENFFTNPSSTNGSISGGSGLVSINGSPAQSFITVPIAGGQASVDFNFVETTDLLLYLGTHTAYDVTSGETAEVSGIDITYTVTSGLNSNLANASSYNVTLTDLAGTAFTDTVVVNQVPEPSSSALLLGLGALGIVALRRRIN